MRKVIQLEHLKRIGQVLAPIVPALLYVGLASRMLFDESIGYPDADRLLMDGVFFADFFRTLPLTNPVEFALTYFAQYPALSIGYKPIFFPVVESFFILLFGETVWAGRIAVMFFGLLGGAALYATVSRMYGTLVAFSATAVLATLPFVVRWSWYTMTEIPVLALVLVTGYFAWRLIETGAIKFVVAAVAAFVAALWTKQAAIFAVLWFLPLLFFNKRYRVLQSRYTLLALGVGLLALLPLAVLTLYLGDLNIGQSFGENPRGEQLPRLASDNLLFYLEALVNDQASWPLAALAAIGALSAMFRLDRRAIYWLLLFVSTYAFFTMLNDPHVSRYTIFWMPAVAVFASLPLAIAQQSRFRVVWFVALLGVLTSNVIASVTAQPQRSSGFQEAASLAVSLSERPAIFIDAYNNGYFTFFVRAYDKNREKFVLRGDKLLSSSAVDTTTWAKEHVESSEGVLNVLRSIRADIVVVEEENYTEFPVHDILRELLKTEQFEELARIPIISTLPRYRDQTLLIYRWKGELDASIGAMELPLPIVGKKLLVPGDGSTPSLIAD